MTILRSVRQHPQQPHMTLLSAFKSIRCSQVQENTFFFPRRQMDYEGQTAYSNLVNWLNL